MNDNHRNLYERAVRLQDYGVQHADIFPAGMNSWRNWVMT
jgi:hypothetical protein